MKAQFGSLHTEILGVSMDSQESHLSFAGRMGIMIPLLADSDGKVSALFGVRNPAGMPNRATFLIDSGGIIRRIWPKVDIPAHAAEVLQAVKNLPKIVNG